ncbi:hypothetical protein K9512_004311 [Vibrio parahaemolyticus]|nr:hypothetical protein [Vibrio parahaemolyticus]
MKKVDKERRAVLKFIQENPDSSSEFENICGYIVDDLFKSGFVHGYRDSELGRGPEPKYNRLQITPKGREFLEVNHCALRISVVLKNPVFVGVISTVVGGLILAEIMKRFFS